MNTTNHYATLGIRSNASTEDVDLAFKARRSQYHPDRYNQNECDTVQWATQQMQQVNAAYQVLCNPSTRAAYDQALQQANQRPKQPGPSTSQPTPTSLSLQQYLAENFSNFAGFDRIYLAPDIPLKKLSGALEGYGVDLDASDVVALIDDTVFGGGGDGVLVTENALFLKSLGSDGRMFQLKAMQALETSKNALYVNGRKLIQLNMPDARGVDALFERIRKFAIQKYSVAHQAPHKPASDQASDAPGSTASAALPTPDELYMATKTQFGVLYRSIRSMDIEDPALEQVFATVALRYFEATEASLANSSLGQVAFDELGKVYLLTCNILEVMQGEEETNTDLLRGEEGDGQLLGLLRSLLKQLGTGGKPAQVQRSADRYFGGD
nr:J domain-containing protein [uncultured Albidiferax sp.]